MSITKYVSAGMERRCVFVIAWALLAMLSLCLAPTHAGALTTTSGRINFQGRLTNNAGTIVADGSYNITFRLYDAVSGGTLQWSEVRETTARIVVVNGLFSVQLGEVSSFTPSIFTNPSLYLEVELPTPASATCAGAGCAVYDGNNIMSPRQRVASAVYAFNADAIDGIDSSQIARIDAGNLFSQGQLIQTTDAAALRVQNAAGAETMFTVDTATSTVRVGDAALDATSVLFVLDSTTTAGDPGGTNGATYYSDTLGKFRCYEAGAWKDCITTDAPLTLQNVYDNASTPATITTTANKGVRIAAGAAPTVDLFTLDTTANPIVTNGVDVANIVLVGGSGAIESSGLRIDMTPGGTAGSMWSGLRVAASATGAQTEVAEYGLLLEGPATPGVGEEVAIKVTTGWDIGIDLGSGGLQLAAQDNPSAPIADNLKVYARNISGRMLLKAMGPSGVDYPLQPSLFQNQITMINAQSGTANGVFGTNRTATGTASHPTADEVYGYMTNYATTTTANSDAGVANSANQFFRGSVNGANGFFFNARIGLPDAEYSSGSRVFVGMTSQTVPNVIGSDNATGSRAGFSYSSARGDTNWQFSTKDGTTEHLTDTGLVFAPQKVYDAYVYVVPQGDTMYWRIDNITDGTSAEGSETQNLPDGAAGLRGAVGLTTLNTTQRNIRMQRIYIEADR